MLKIQIIIDNSLKIVNIIKIVKYCFKNIFSEFTIKSDDHWFSGRTRPIAQNQYILAWKQNCYYRSFFEKWWLKLELLSWTTAYESFIQETLGIKSNDSICMGYSTKKMEIFSIKKIFSLIFLKTIWFGLFS